jgi:hypothetical protein
VLSLRSIYPIHAFQSRLKLWCLTEQQNGRRQEVNGAAAEDCCGERGISLRFIPWRISPFVLTQVRIPIRTIDHASIPGGGEVGEA